MPGPESRPEFVDGKPFIIRGHHLKIYSLLLRKFSGDASKLAGISTRRLTYTLSFSEYAKDVLGSKDQASKYEEDYRLTLQTFLQLKDNYPVEIVEGKRDGICGACAIGDHCQKLEKSLFGRVRGDWAYTDSFLKDSDRLHLAKPTIIFEDAYYSNVKGPRQVRRIRTTAGATKKVLQEGKRFSLLRMVLKEAVS